MDTASDRGRRATPPPPPRLRGRLSAGSVVALLCLAGACLADRTFGIARTYGTMGVSLLTLGACLLAMTGLTACIGLGRWQRVHQLAARYRSIHGWVGITTGSLLAMGFLAGTFTLFAAPLQQWSAPPLPAQEAHFSAIPLTEIPALIGQLPEAASTHYRLTLTSPSTARISIPTGPDIPLGIPSPSIIISQPAPHTIHFYRLTPSPVPNFIGGLHRRLGLPLPERWVMPFVGILCLFYGLALLSGIILLLPGIWRSLMTVRLQGHARRLWLDLHSLLGLCTLPFQLVIALTTALFAFFPLLSIFFGSPASMKPAAGPVMGQHSSALLSPASALLQLRTLSPSFHPLTLDYVSGPHGGDSLAERISLQAPLYNANGSCSLPMSEQPYLLAMGTDPFNALIGRDRGSVLLDPHTGTVLDSQNLPGQQSAARHFLTWCLALHFGSFGGEFVHWLYAALGLCGVGFFHTANKLWLNTHRLKITGQAQPADTHATLWLGRLSEGSLLGCLLGLCSIIALSPLMSHLHPVSNGMMGGTSTSSPMPTMTRSCQQVRLTYYGCLAFSMVAYCLLSRRLCRGMMLSLAAIALSTAIIVVTLRHSATQDTSSLILTSVFSVAALCLWRGAFRSICARP